MKEQRHAAFKREVRANILINEKYSKEGKVLWKKNKEHSIVTPQGRMEKNKLLQNCFKESHIQKKKKNQGTLPIGIWQI